MVVLIEDFTRFISASTLCCRRDDEAKKEDLKHRLSTAIEFSLKLYTNPQSSNISNNELVFFIAYMTPLKPLNPFHLAKLASMTLSSNCKNNFPSAWILVSINTLFSSSKLRASLQHPDMLLITCLHCWLVGLLLAFNVMETFSTTFWYCSRPVIPIFSTWHTSQSFELSSMYSSSHLSPTGSCSFCTSWMISLCRDLNRATICWSQSIDMKLCAEIACSRLSRPCVRVVKKPFTSLKIECPDDESMVSQKGANCNIFFHNSELLNDSDWPTTGNLLSETWILSKT